MESKSWYMTDPSERRNPSIWSDLRDDAMDYLDVLWGAWGQLVQMNRQHRQYWRNRRYAGNSNS